MRELTLNMAGLGKSTRTTFVGIDSNPKGADFVIRAFGSDHEVFADRENLALAIYSAMAYFNHRYGEPNIVFIRRPDMDDGYEVKVERLLDGDYQMKCSLHDTALCSASGIVDSLEMRFDTWDEMVANDDDSSKAELLADLVIRPLIGTLKNRGVLTEFEWEHLLNVTNSIIDGSVYDGEDAEEGQQDSDDSPSE